MTTSNVERQPRRLRSGTAAVDVASAGPLAGFTVAVTADRGRDELATLLRSRGARVVLTPALREVPPDAGDARHREAGPARRDAGDARHREAGPARRDAGDARHREAGPARRDAGDARHREAGPARRQDEVTAGPPWGPPDDPGPLRRLGDLIRDRLVDAVTFTSAPAVWGVLETGGPAVLDRLRTDVVAACVGPEAAEPLLDHGVPVVAPSRPRLGDLVDVLVAALPRGAPTLKVAGALVTLRGHAVVVNEALEPLAPGPMAVLRALAEARGEVLSRTELRRVLPPGADGHTVDMAVARLRVRLRGSAFVEAVPRRGYRLAVD
jgi:uroporphyrinogen-III synthase